MPYALAAVAALATALLVRSRALKWFGTGTDVHDEREGQRALRESEERFRSLTAAVSQIVWTNDAGGRMRGEQPSWAAYTGQAQAEYQDLGWTACVHPDDVAATLARWWEAVGRRCPCEMEHRVRRVDGEYRTFAVRGIPILNADGSVREWVGCHTDVTEQRAAAAAMRHSHQQLERLAEERGTAVARSEERFQSFMAHSPLISFIKDESGRYLYVSPTWSRAFQRSESEIVGQRDDQWLPAEFAEQMMAADREILRTGETIEQVQLMPAASSRSLCEAMGYQLSVESTQGEGSTFSVTLAAAPARRG